MKLIEKIKKFFKKEDDLRTRCIEAYGEDFAKLYDTLGTGGTIGNLTETLVVLQMIVDIRNH